MQRKVTDGDDVDPRSKTHSLRGNAGSHHCSANFRVVGLSDLTMKRGVNARYDGRNGCLSYAAFCSKSVRLCRLLCGKPTAYRDRLKMEGYACFIDVGAAVRSQVRYGEQEAYRNGSAIGAGRKFT